MGKKGDHIVKLNKGKRNLSDFARTLEIEKQNYRLLEQIRDIGNRKTFERFKVSNPLREDSLLQNHDDISKLSTRRLRVFHHHVIGANNSCD